MFLELICWDSLDSQQNIVLERPSNTRESASGQSLLYGSMGCAGFLWLWLITCCDTGAQNPSLVVSGFFILSYSTLDLLKNTFDRIKISCF